VIVQRVVMPGTGLVSWTVLGEDGLPVPAVESYLAHLAALERSPQTVRGYAIGLRFFLDYLAGRGLAWDEVHLEDVGHCAASRSNRPAARAVKSAPDE
jgi:integrase/recombinase XerD